MNAYYYPLFFHFSPSTTILLVFIIIKFGADICRKKLLSKWQIWMQRKWNLNFFFSVSSRALNKLWLIMVIWLSVLRLTLCDHFKQFTQKQLIVVIDQIDFAWTLKIALIFLEKTYYEAYEDFKVRFSATWNKTFI